MFIAFMICHCYSLSFNLWTCCFRFTSYRAYRWISGFCVCVLICFSSVRLFPTLWTVACKAPLSMEFSRQEYWSGLSCPSPRHLPNPGIKPLSLTSPALAIWFFTTNATWEALNSSNFPQYSFI